MKVSGYTRYELEHEGKEEDGDVMELGQQELIDQGCFVSAGAL
jgi:hypothetical protein